MLSLSIKSLIKMNSIICKNLSIHPEVKRPNKRDKAMYLVRSRRSLLLILSPMCTAFSALQNINFAKMDPGEISKMREMNFGCFPSKNCLAEMDETESNCENSAGEGAEGPVFKKISFLTLY